MPPPEPRRPKPARRLRCESCLEVLSLRHAWDTATCSCGALRISGRPTRPVVSWLSRPGGGWTEMEDEIGSDSSPGHDPGPEPPEEPPARRLGFPLTASGAGG